MFFWDCRTQCSSGSSKNKLTVFTSDKVWKLSDIVVPSFCTDVDLLFVFTCDYRERIKPTDTAYWSIDVSISENLAAANEPLMQINNSLGDVNSKKPILNVQAKHWRNFNISQQEWINATSPICRKLSVVCYFVRLFLGSSLAELDSEWRTPILFRVINLRI